MAFIHQVTDDEATGRAAELFDADRAALGYVPNYTRLFAHRPAVYDAWAQLNGAIKANMELRRYELATLAAARELRSSYCSLAHGKVIATKFMPAQDVRDVATGAPTGAVDELDRAVMALVTKLVRDAGSVTQADLDGLVGLGLAETDVLDVVLAAAARCFFSTVLDALGALPDAAYGQLEPGLREALTVGRPIEGGDAVPAP